MSQILQSKPATGAAEGSGVPLPPDEVYQHLVEGLRTRDREIQDLKRALETSRTIGVAVGIVMATVKCTRDEAFSTIAVCSNKLNRKLTAVADYVEQTGALPSSRAVLDACAASAGSGPTGRSPS